MWKGENVPFAPTRGKVGQVIYQPHPPGSYTAYSKGSWNLHLMTPSLVQGPGLHPGWEAETFDAAEMHHMEDSLMH